MRVNVRAVMLGALFGAASVTWGAPHDAGAQELAIACGALGTELELCQEATEAWTAESGIPVAVVPSPNSASERLAIYQQLLAAGSADIDVFWIDVIWPGILGPHLIDLSATFDDATMAAFFPTIVANNTVDGELKAIPWFADAGVLFYRSDLLAAYGHEPPETWTELAAIAEDIQAGERAAGNSRMQGFVFQGNPYEGLTCNALEWIYGHDGGTIVNAAGDVTINNPNAAAALTLAAGWIGTIAPRGVLSYLEEESRGVFQAGHAVFMRNWPYAWALANEDGSPVKGKVGVTILPRGEPDGRHAGVFGGASLGVSKYTDMPAAAVELVAYLTSYEEQKRRAIEGALHPTIRALYDDEDVLAANPFFSKLEGAFDNAVARPSTVTGARYNQVSTEFWNAVHATLVGSVPAEKSLADLERRLQRISRTWQ